MRLTVEARIPLLPVAATSLWCAAVITAIVGAQEISGGNPQDRIWLVLIVLLGVLALALLRVARDDRRKLALGIGWAVLGIGACVVALRRTPSPGPGAPLTAGWALLVVAGAAAVLGGVLLAVRPWSRPRSRRGFAPLVVLGVCVMLAAGYWGAVSWTYGQNVRLTVADAGPLRSRTAALDGRMLWHSMTTGQIVGTEGGLLATQQGGVRMIDPNTGTTRWSYQRTDITAIIEPPVASADGKLVAIVTLPSTVPTGQQHSAQLNEQTARLLVLDAATGALVSDTTGPYGLGTVIALTDTTAYVMASPNVIDAQHVTAIPSTGPSAGRASWIFTPPTGCSIARFSVAGAEVAVSTTCGAVSMFGPHGTPLWTYQLRGQAAELWPLTGAPSGTVLVLAQAPEYFNNLGFEVNQGLAQPAGIVELDARTGAVRWQQTDLPPPPFTPESQDAGVGIMSPLWAAGTAVLAYYLPGAQEVWLYGIDPTTLASWSETTIGMYFGATSQPLSDYLATLPDGRIVLASQNANASNQLDAQPVVFVVNGHTGRALPSLAFPPIPSSTGFLGGPAAVATPAGVVLTVTGPYESTTGAPDPGTPPPVLLIGLH